MSATQRLAPYLASPAAFRAPRSLAAWCAGWCAVGGAVGWLTLSPAASVRHPIAAPNRDGEKRNFVGTPPTTTNMPSVPTAILVTPSAAGGEEHDHMRRALRLVTTAWTGWATCVLIYQLGK